MTDSTGDFSILPTRAEITVFERIFAYTLGHLATALFASVYLPQLWLNFKRKSTEGFSLTSMGIKVIGGSFLLVNTVISGEVLAVIIYGLITLIQYQILILQIALYSSRPLQALWLFFPVIPIVLGTQLPESMVLTNTIKPLTQLASHAAQLLLLVRRRSTKGCSILSQHFNVIGGILGLAMLIVIPPVSTSTYYLYLNSLAQGGSFYAVVWYCEGWRHVFRIREARASESTGNTKKSEDAPGVEYIPTNSHYDNVEPGDGPVSTPLASVTGDTVRHK